jgi:hypothetical protein
MRTKIGNWTGRAGLSFVLLMGSGTTHAQAIGSVAHPFPKSRGQILVFTDQLPNQPTSAQWNFIAANYVGTQKALASWTHKVRQINPNFVVLHYQLALGCSTAQFVDGNIWTNDFGTVSQNNSWFLLDSGSRIKQIAWGWYVMNITS